MTLSYMTRIAAVLCCMTLFVAGAGAGEEGARPTAADARSAYDAGTLFVDVRSDEAIFNAVRQFLAMNDAERRAMMLASIEAGFKYSQENAAISEICLLLA